MKKWLGIYAFFMMAPIFASTGPYVQSQVGYGKLATGSANGLDHHYGGLSGRLSAGYLFGGRQLRYGAELGLASYASSCYQSANTSLTYQGASADLLGVLSYQLGARWNVFGKLGLAYIDQQTEGNLFPNQLDSSNALQPKVALGLGYSLTAAIGVNLSYSHTFGDQPEGLAKNAEPTPVMLNKVASTDLLSFGLSYRF
ncbi:hypothetical protein AVI51_07815 [Piscirickettsia salmonis]|uniref:Opacity protein antigen n=1 Tax=Piscirickettsia salmonis TaxID=1238 RepID=A0A9Q5VIC0_PISSA|nr:outer membrane beta-barrel protein [Piscirickettsia salmonis]ALA25985.1 membrane protein [Piscirickettsia salmonis]APS43446.1 hypothetical protein AVI48_03030 [Piscirickettsia salmonis]APS46798.1 hypothetical protein AVI49_03640 [Piscirickettsia salmonis]APS50772.1 hypothetical protein AVI50_07905 [Piscirickettsia salmonis]APS53976.1 hypothetical protein AVI51_07815 [Piscirickettsia salmonis]